QAQHDNAAQGRCEQLFDRTQQGCDHFGLIPEAASRQDFAAIAPRRMSRRRGGIADYSKRPPTIMPGDLTWIKALEVAVE
ncbi:MAG TPA: hypothetical protein VGN21_20335, partial [Stellaceae bacterium]